MTVQMKQPVMLLAHCLTIMASQSKLKICPPGPVPATAPPAPSHVYILLEFLINANV